MIRYNPEACALVKLTASCITRSCASVLFEVVNAREAQLLLNYVAQQRVAFLLFIGTKHTRKLRAFGRPAGRTVRPSGRQDRTGRDGLPAVDAGADRYRCQRPPCRSRACRQRWWRTAPRSCPESPRRAGRSGAGRSGVWHAIAAGSDAPTASGRPSLKRPGGSRQPGVLIGTRARQKPARPGLPSPLRPPARYGTARDRPGPHPPGTARRDPPAASSRCRRRSRRQGRAGRFP